MGLQKYRADTSEIQPDGATCWHTEWMGGRPYAKIQNCRFESLSGEPRVTAYVQGEPDTWFSIPAKCHYRGVIVNGYLTGDGESNIVFRHTYY